MLFFRKPIEGVERPQMPADVVIVGGGPAGMACALRLAQLIDAHNAAHPDSQLTKENIYVLEKAREIGQHCLSGALLDPRSMNELLPGFEKEAPLDAKVIKEAYPDPTVSEGDWPAVDLVPVKTLNVPVSLETIRADKLLKEMLLVRQSRLSVAPLTGPQFNRLMELAQTKP